ncbi:MAG: nucleoside-diphosphate sugar epimerase/dehydratase [Caryophanon sp.]|nr:nucleoside-diphosphate sugar epimerase/dehydratase [Caryophanon sp.]
MSYRIRYAAFFLLDSVIVLTAIFVSYWILNPTLNVYSDELIVLSALTLLIGHHIAAYFFKLYSRIWSVASVRELVLIFYAVTFSIIVAAGMQQVLMGDVYFRVLSITWLLHIVAIGGSRFLVRVVKDRQMAFKNTAKLKRVLIVGAGQAGTMLVRNLQRHDEETYLPVCLVDDDPHKQNLKILDVTVAGTTKDIPRLVEEKQIDEIIIAMPAAGKKGIAAVYDNCVGTGVVVKVMPKIEDVMTGQVQVNDIKEVKIEDLLGRDEVELDMIAISQALTDKTILVTGAGGSIGSEICRQVSKFQPRKLLLLGHGENSIYTIHMELLESGLQKTELIPIIADVQDRARIFEVVNMYKPDVIYHAAAHKHVPLMEYNPYEAVKNNVFGTKNVAEAAHEFGVTKFVLVSTDKAVNPPNVMGATKRIAEMVIQDLARRSKTTFAAVRFGNVLGSRGSVVPRFKAQIAAGGPITVTHPDMTRYFMTIPEASRLVLQAGTLARGGEVFVLDMGEPVKIVDLAKNIIRLSGFTEQEIPIEFTGIRPGEKMYEELLNPEEIQEQNIFPKIHVGKANCMESDDLRLLLKDFQLLSKEELKEKVILIANGCWQNDVK